MECVANRKESHLRTRARRRAGAALCAGCALAAWLAGCVRSGQDDALATAEATRGPIVAVVEGRGVVEPLAEVDIQTRISAKLARILPDGARVKPGDVVAELESIRIRTRLADSEAALRVARAELKRQTAYADMRVDSARYSLQLAEANAAVAKAQYETVKAGLMTPEEEKIRVAAALKESEIDRRHESHKYSLANQLARMGVEDKVVVERQRVQKELAELDARKAHVEYQDVMKGVTEEDLREAELKLALAQHKLRAARKKLEERIKSKERIVASYERRVRRYERYVKRYQKQLEATVIKAPSPGVVMVKNMWGRKLTPGRYVYRNQTIASLPDLSRLKVRLWVSEHDAARVREGQRAEIVPATDPTRRVKGKVIQVGRLVKEAANDLSDRERKHLPQGVDRVVSVDVEILPSAAPLKCGVFTHVRIVTEEKADVVRIPQIGLRTRSRVVFALDAAAAEKIVPGASVEVSTPAAPDAVCRGAVTKVGRWAADGEVAPIDSSSRRPEAAEAALDEADERVRPGGRLVVSVALPGAGDEHFFPKRKVRLERLYYVLVRGSEGDQERPVKPGLSNGYEVEIASGLRAGERVVLAGASP